MEIVEDTFTNFDSTLVVPGQVITSEVGYLRGHGSYIQEQGSGPALTSSVAGQIERVNKLISVIPVKSRYIGEVGDLVVGRISTVESKRWRTDIGGQRDATLQLSSVNLPGGVQRMRTYEDQLQMRTLFTEGDLISAEIQNISSDGTVSLHTRSLKYGKLENGQLIVVPPALIKRLPQHYVPLPWGIDVILGKNGFIWIARSISDEWKSQEGDEGSDLLPVAETLQRLRQRHAQTPVTMDERLRIARVRNAIYILSQVFIPISPHTISVVYQRSEEQGISVKDMLLLNNVALLTDNIVPN